MSDKTEEPTSAGRIAVLDLGKKKRSAVKKLRRGEGPLLSAVDEQIQGLREQGLLSGDPNVVVVVVERKQRLPGGRIRLF